MMRSRPLITAMLLVASLAFAIVGAAGERERATDDRGVLLVIAQAPAKTRDWKNPYEGNSDALLAGKKLYLQHCADCHGQNARGMRNAISLRTPQVQECDRRRARLVSAQRKFILRDAGVVRLARTTPLANRHLSKIPSLTFRRRPRVYQRAAPSSRARDSCYNIAWSWPATQVTLRKPI